MTKVSTMMKACIPILFFALLASCKSSDDKSAKEAMVFAPANTKSVKLPVKVLPTIVNDNNEVEAVAFNYPAEMSLYGLDNIDEVAAYGAAHQLWLGPKGWTGKGFLGKSRAGGVELRPKGEDTVDWPHRRVMYGYEFDSREQMVLYAAEYFPEARAEYLIKHKNDDEIPDTEGWTIERKSEHMVIFRSPEYDGLITRGVVYFRGDSSNACYYEAEFTLPLDKAGLVELLEKQYISTLPK